MTAIIMVHKYGLETDSILASLAAILESEAFGTYSRAQLQAQAQQSEALKRKNLLQQGPSAIESVGLPDCNGERSAHCLQLTLEMPQMNPEHLTGHILELTHYDPTIMAVLDSRCCGYCCKEGIHCRSQCCKQQPRRGAGSTEAYRGPYQHMD